MNTTVGSPEIGQWYERMDTGMFFVVTGQDERYGTIEMQSLGGDVDEIEAQVWSRLPLELAQPSLDWTAPVEDMEAQDLACSQAETLLENPRALEQLG